MPLSHDAIATRRFEEASGATSIGQPESRSLQMAPECRFLMTRPFLSALRYDLNPLFDGDRLHTVSGVSVDHGSFEAFFHEVCNWHAADYRAD